MKRMILAAAVAATAAVTLTPPEAEARGRGFVRIGFVGVQHYRVHRVYRPVVFTSYPAYCRWYRTHYGAVKRCFY